MQRIIEYLKERNIPKDSLEANSILEGYELGVERTKKKAVEWLKGEMFYKDHSSGRGSWGVIKAFGAYDSLEEFIEDFKQAMEE